MNQRFQACLIGISIAAATLSLPIGCDSRKETSTASLEVPDESKSLLTTGGVGAYRIGLSTLQEVLGADTNKARQRLSAQGLSCEFNEGALLTAITVTSPDYAFANGLSVGCSAADVRSKTGEPLGTSFQTDKLKFNALVYERVVFLLDDAESVYAIRIGK